MIQSCDDRSPLECLRARQGHARCEHDRVVAERRGRRVRPRRDVAEGSHRRGGLARRESEGPFHRCARLTLAACSCSPSTGATYDFAGDRLSLGCLVTPHATSNHRASLTHPPRLCAIPLQAGRRATMSGLPSPRPRRGWRRAARAPALRSRPSSGSPAPARRRRRRRSAKRSDRQPAPRRPRSRCNASRRSEAGTATLARSSWSRR